MSLIPHFVTLEPKEHKYWDIYGNEYMSVSKFKEKFKNDFDTETRSYQSARKELRAELIFREPSEHEIRFRQQILKDKWAAKNKASTDIGTEIHNAIESFLKLGVVDPKWPFVPNMIAKYFPEYSAIFPEECVYSKRYWLAGTSDLPILRAKSKIVIDIYDWKTNMAKGITYHSEYKNRLLGPLSHLEECSYVEYCLQLSIYARILEEHGWKIGKMALIYIPPAEPEKHFLIPVPYMRADVELMFSWAEHYGHLKARPQENLIPLPR